VDKDDSRSTENRPPAGPGRIDLSEVVEALCETHDGLVRPRENRLSSHVLPSRDVLVAVVEDVRSVLFPGYFGTSEVTPETLRFHVGATLDRVFRTLREQVRRGLCFGCVEEDRDSSRFEKKAETLTQTFLGMLPNVRHQLSLDVQAHFEGDPAATCPDETIFCYPGVQAITCYRIAHALFALEVPLLPRIVTEYAHSTTGIDIHPGAHIGEKFFIDHGTGVVIGETTVIGDRVKVYQGVTLGAKSFPLDENGNPIKNIPRHPVVEDDVIIYGGATILGRVTIGEGSVIGGNVWLTEDVPPGSHVSVPQSVERG